MSETPCYYKSQDGSDIDCIDTIAAMGCMESFCKGNILKYLWRAGRKKDLQLEDLHKAMHYMRLLIEYVERK